MEPPTPYGSETVSAQSHQNYCWEILKNWNFKGALSHCLASL